MTYQKDNAERSVFQDTVIIFTSSNGALTPEVGWRTNTDKRTDDHQTDRQNDIFTIPT